MSASSRAEQLIGKPVLRLEDPALLRGRARFVDDLPVKPGTLHAAILRSPHPHAEIISIDTSKASRAAGVAAVVTRDHVLALTDPFIIGLTTPLEYRCLATDRVRFVGEPVAVVLASDRYRAEDALEAITVEYRPLPAAIDPVAAAAPTAPVLHPKVGSNVVVSRDFVHGDVAGAFAQAAHRTELTLHFPRNSIPPMEGFAVIAEHLGDEDGYDTISNFQGPFSLHTVMARALRMPSNRLRVRTASHSGGAFGVKLVLYVSIVLMCVAARVSRRPVKWIEDRLEHLAAANSMANRTCKVEAAFADDGKVLAIRYHHWDDHGAYLRAPMPAPTIRAHAFCTGAYAIAAVQEIIDVVMTNKTPTGAVRGFGAPQIHFALERIMHQVAVELGSARGDAPQLGRRGCLSLPSRGRRTLRFRQLPGRDRRSCPARKPRRAQASARPGESAEAVLRDRLCGGDRSRPVEHGLHRNGENARGAARHRPEERRNRHGDGRGRSARCGERDRRFRSTRTGPPHRAGADRGTTARPASGANRGQSGARHAKGRVVARCRKLRLPVRADLQHRHRHGGDQGAGEARPSGRSPPQCASG
jgi:hypothetical protein